jgi:hypothetical protein
MTWENLTEQEQAALLQFRAELEALNNEMRFEAERSEGS